MTLYDLFLFSIFGVVSLAQGCPVGYSGHGTSCYGYVDHQMTWMDAQSTCASLGAFLPEVFSADENQFIFNMSMKHGGHSLWLGGDDLVEEGVWTWAKSGVDVLAYTAWAHGEPDKHSPTDENCLVMNGDGRWNDDQCYHTRRFVCQRLDGNAFVG